MTHDNWLNDSFKAMCQMERKGQKEEGGRKFLTLNKWDQIRWREGKRRERKREKKRKKNESRVRNSTFSLRSTEIGPSVFVGARGKVYLRDESFA